MTTEAYMGDTDAPIAALLKPKVPTSGEFYEQTSEDGEPTGLVEYQPTPEFKKVLESFLDQETTAALDAYKPVYARAERNAAVYAAEPRSDETIQLPMVKRDANQQEAFLVNRFWKQNPIVSVIPLEMIEQEVIIPGPEVMDPMTGIMEQTSEVRAYAAERIADDIEKFFEHYLKGPIDFRGFLAAVVGDCCRGATPTWGKNQYLPQYRVRRVPNMVEMRGPDGRKRKVIRGVRETRVQTGTAYRIDPISVYYMAMSPEALDPQEAVLLSEWVPMDDTTVRANISNGTFNMVDNEDERAILGGASDLSEELSRRWEKPGTDEGSPKATNPRMMHDIRLQWFFHPILEEDGSIGVYDFYGYYHRTARKLLSLCLNPYEERPYYAYFQKKRPHEFRGDSVTEDVAPLQKVASTLVHLEIKNRALANLVALQVRQESVAWRWLQNNTLRPGSKIPFSGDGDIKPFSIGQSMQSSSDLTGLMMSEGSKLSVVSEFSRGGNIPGRTAAAAVNLVMESGNAQPLMILDSLRDQLSKQLTGFLRMVSRHSVYGVDIPFRDPDTRAILRHTLRFPAEGIGDQFSIRITASSDEDTAQAEFERTTLVHQMVIAHNKETLGKMGPALEGPPSAKMMFRKMIVSEQRIAERLLKLAKLDPAKHIFTEAEIDEVFAVQEQWNQLQQQLQQAQQAAAQMQQQLEAMSGAGQGLPGVVNAPGAGGFPPGVQAPQGAGASGMAGAPGNGVPGGLPPQGDIPPPGGGGFIQ